MSERVVELDITALAAGGDGVARDTDGRVTFVPLSAPGDRIRAKLVKETKSFARGELVEIVTPSPVRVAPACEAFVRGCGGCQWLHVARFAQLEAKQALVTSALRKLDGLVVERIAEPAPQLGWRRRARFHSVGGKLGLYAAGSRSVIALEACPQLEPALDAVVKLLAAASLPDGEVTLGAGPRGEIVVGIEKPWRPAASFVGRGGIVGVVAGGEPHGEPVIELEPGLYTGPWDFAQASAAGNAALVAVARAALGKGPGELVELYAGGGNLTRGFVDDGWTVRATDVVAPARAPELARPVAFEAGPVERVLAAAKPCDALVLDPPREGAAAAISGIVKLGPKRIVYVSCDPATLARDAHELVAAGYRADRAWPLDLMPQTAHVEIVLRLVTP